MRIYIKKLGEKSFMVMKETTLQSVLSDSMTILVLISAFACDIAFSLLVTHSFLFDLLTFLMIAIYVFGVVENKKEEITKEELNKIIESL